MHLGCHLSISKGFKTAAETAVSIGANTFQFFTRNPRGGRAKAIDPKDLIGLEAILEKHRFGPLFAHGSYTMNLASDKADVREFAKGILLDDMDRLAVLPPNTLYVFHPGSYVSGNPQTGMEWIVAALEEAVARNPKANICLEGMSGTGTEIGSEFEQLGAIIRGVTHNENLGICLDTCHLYSAGYDIKGDLDGVLQQIDEYVGIDRVRMIHLNDSKAPLGSHKDRHEKLGEGTLGWDAIIAFITHPKLIGTPINLETPNEIEGYKEEIEEIRRRTGQPLL
ncbi:MAG: deoxyribonuclease IV [Tissierellia bacterium]|nr:deoxyribonuclease IV [Tissierellia bacterium]